MPSFLEPFISFIRNLFGLSNAGSTSSHAQVECEQEGEGSSFLEETWSEREERVYKSFFPNLPETIYTPQDSSKVAIGGEILVLSHAGVFEIPPTKEKKYWAYITSGLSNPFGDEPEEISGFGCELLI
jgi:hypothetical protein